LLRSQALERPALLAVEAGLGAGRRLGHGGAGGSESDGGRCFHCGFRRLVRLAPQLHHTLELGRERAAAVELFFKWIKQNLELKRFMAKNPKAVRLQIITALIAFVALKLLHHAIAATAPLKRLKALCKNNLLNQHELYTLINPKPPKPPDPSTPQLVMNFPGQ